MRPEQDVYSLPLPLCLIALRQCLSLSQSFIVLAKLVSQQILGDPSDSISFN